jgi:hypothetical protein
MDIHTQLKQMAEIAGADFFGVADLSLAHDAILAQGGAVVADYPRALAIGIALLQTIVDQLRNGRSGHWQSVIGSTLMMQSISVSILSRRS